jgi:AraC-like DNA-binding protein
MVTADGSPNVMSLGSMLLHHQSGGVPIYFEDGFLTPVHKNNHIDLTFVLEGRLQKQIDGNDYEFNRGDSVLVNKDVNNAEYLYRKNMGMMSLGISNAFFDKSMTHLDMMDGDAKDFLRRFVFPGNTDYRFIRFVPKDTAPQISALLEQILQEMWKPRPGGTHLIIGYVERLLSLLPQEYTVTVERNDRNAACKIRFEEIRRFLEEQYAGVTVEKLVETFGHDIYYFNRLVKRQTGMTYSEFLRDIRLEKARVLLRTTAFPIEDIAHRAGYENMGYFYKIFMEKYHQNPGDMRKAGQSPKNAN